MTDLDDAALNVGRQLVRHAVTVWLDVRHERATRGRELMDLLAVGVPDRFHRRDLARQFEQIGDETVRRLRPLYTVEFREVADNERAAALNAVLTALGEADLSDASLFAADLEPIALARRVRAQVPDAARRELLDAGATELYRALLDESCVALVHIIRRLPEFTPATLTEILGRTTALADEIGEVLARLPRTSLDAPQGREHDAEFRDRYLNLVSAELDKLDLFGVDTHHYRPRTRVSVAYFSLTVSHDGHARFDRPRDEDWFTGRRERETGGVRVEDALAESPRTLLFGDAGSGKTTLLQWVAVNCARGGFTGRLAAWNGRIPFFLRLRAYADRPAPKPEEFPAGIADPIIGLMPDGWVHRQLAENGVLLVDGVDELVPGQRGRVREWLDRLVTAYPKLPIVVTSRPAAAGRSWLAEQDFRTVRLEPMSPADIEEFCRRWHEAIRSATEHDPSALPCPAEELGDYRAALLRNLDARRTLRTLATTPLLCAMLCALNLDRHRQLPPDRMALYAASLDMLLERRDADRNVPAAQEVRLSKETKLAILRHLAWRLTEAGRVELTFTDCVHHVSRAIDRLRDVEIGAEQALHFLLTRSGVIRDPAEHRVDFVHRTFQEYLAAKEATEDHLMDTLIRRAHSERWRETIIMAAGHATAQNRAELLSGILDRADNEPKHARLLRLLAGACLETSSTIEPDLRARIDAGLDFVTPPRSSRESRSLAIVGNHILRKLPTSLDEVSEAVGAACVRTAALVNGPEAVRRLAGYAADPRDAVQLELASVWRYFDAEEYAREVLADAPLLNGTIDVEQREHARLARHLNRLTNLRVFDRQDGTDFDWLHGVPHLVRLNAVSTRKFNDLSGLVEHQSLSILWIQGRGFAGSLNPLGSLTNIEDLMLSLRNKKCSLSFLAKTPKLRSLDLSKANALIDPNQTIPWQQLTQLRLRDSTEKLAKYAARCENLEHLSLIDSKRELDLRVVEPILAQLRVLNITSFALRNIELLAHLKRINYLGVGRTDISNLEPLLGNNSLQTLALHGSRPGLDLSPLAELTRRITIRLAPGQEVTGLAAVQDKHRIVWA